MANQEPKGQQPEDEDAEFTAWIDAVTVEMIESLRQHGQENVERWNERHRQRVAEHEARLKAAETGRVQDDSGAQEDPKR